jgi:hypothetical protein
MRSVPLVLLAFAMLTTAWVPARAQGWKIDSDINLTLTQNAYSDNWEGGESGSLNWAINSNTVAEKQILAKVYNKNTLKLAYGLTYRQDVDTKKWGSGDKTTDLIDLESTYRYTMGTLLEPIFAFRGISQFRDESDPEKIRAVNPLDLTESVGVARTFIKDEKREWQTRVGVAAKQLINRDQLDPVAGTRKTETQTDGGFELVNDVRMPLAQEKIEWTSKLTVFQGVLSSVSDKVKGTPEANYWRYPDVNFENIFTSNVTKYIAVNLYVQLLYDRQIDANARFKQTLALALTYKLM